MMGVYPKTIKTKNASNRVEAYRGSKGETGRLRFAFHITRLHASSRLTRSPTSANLLFPKSIYRRRGHARGFPFSRCIRKWRLSHSAENWKNWCKPISREVESASEFRSGRRRG